MKLISMTEFVLEQAPKFNPLGSDEQASIFEKIHNYAKFISQPLKLGMFVPVDAWGNILDSPDKIKKDLGLFHPNHAFVHGGWQTNLCSYEKLFKNAENNVLFHGFFSENSRDYATNGHFYCDQEWCDNNTIEKLLIHVRDVEFLLTPAALKQIES